VYFNIPKNRFKTEANKEIDWAFQVDCFLRDTHPGNVRVLGDFDISGGIAITLEDLSKL